MDKEEFAAELKSSLAENELSASELARTLALHPSTVHNWLKGKSLPLGPKKWAELTRTLGRDLQAGRSPLYTGEAPLPVQALGLLRQVLQKQRESVAQLEQIITVLESAPQTREC